MLAYMHLSLVSLLVSGFVVILRIVLFDFSLIGFLLYYVGLPGVLWVLPDSYLDVPNKDYGGLFARNLRFYAMAIHQCLVTRLLSKSLVYCFHSLMFRGSVRRRKSHP